jgi:NAD(P)-dependent dehydrogenase (short-subunit alcohol dehydrogenase family)
VAGGDEGSAGPGRTGGDRNPQSRRRGRVEFRQRDEQGRRRAHDRASDGFVQGLHAIISPAGILRDVMFHKMTDQDWEQVIDVHLHGSYNVCRAAINHFREQSDGSFVLFTSTSGTDRQYRPGELRGREMGIAGLSRIIAMEGACRRMCAPTSSRRSRGRA